MIYGIGYNTTYTNDAIKYNNTYTNDNDFESSLVTVSELSLNIC